MLPTRGLIGDQVEGGWTPHSPRAGDASENLHDDHPLTDVKEGGTWLVVIVEGVCGHHPSKRLGFHQACRELCKDRRLLFAAPTSTTAPDPHPFQV